MNVDPKVPPIAVGYARAENSHELEKLKLRVREFCAAEGIDFRGFHCDRGRPANGLRSARGLALALGAELLVVTDMGQFGYSPAFRAGIFDKLREDGIRVMSIVVTSIVAHQIVHASTEGGAL